MYVDGTLKPNAADNTVYAGGVPSVNVAEFLNWNNYGNEHYVASIEIYQRVLSTLEINEAMAKSTTTRVGKPLG